MKFIQESKSEVLIEQCGDGYFVAMGQRYQSSQQINWLGEVRAWEVQHYSQIQSQHFEASVALNAELVIISTGKHLQFLTHTLMLPLIQRRIGFEWMDFHAACRTFNLLVSEKRKVIALLLIEQGCNDGSIPAF